MDISVIYEAIGALHASNIAEGSLEETNRALCHVRSVRGWLDARLFELTARLQEVSSFPENDLAVASRTSSRSASTTIRRADTVAVMAGFNDKLAEGAISTEHVDVLSRELRRLKASDRPAFTGQSGRLAAFAAHSTLEEFEKRARDIADTVDSDRGEDLLMRQQAAARLRTRLDKRTGMWHINGQFDPESGVRMQGKIDAMLAAKFADKVPDGAPDDAGEKQDWLRAQAFTVLLLDDVRPGSGRPETVVVVDTTTGRVRWPFNVDLPDAALRRFMALSRIHFVGIGLDGITFADDRLDLGRTQRQANRAQRRALGAIYATCGVPGCCVRYEQTKLHHLIWWRNGGETNLNNLLPLCERHHQNVHNDGWLLSLGPQRTLTIKLPDGRTMKTGPPGAFSRQAA